MAVSISVNIEDVKVFLRKRYVEIAFENCELPCEVHFSSLVLMMRSMV